jgi:hypothetical protein
MKTEEDEAFDDLAKRQGMWGGGFMAKRAMAADKFQQPAPNKKRPLESDYASHVAYTRALEMYCDTLEQSAQEPVAWITPDGEGFRIRFSAPTNDVPLGWDALYTPPPKREWVGLTDEEMYLNCPNWLSQEQCKSWIQQIEAKLKKMNI